MNDSEERGCCFFVSGSNSAPLFEASPEFFNEMLATIGPFKAGDRCITSFCRNDWSIPHVPDPFTESIRSIAFVSYDPHGNRREMFEHDWRHWQFMSLSGRNSEIYSFPVSISNYTNFRAIATARAARRFTMVSIFERSPFFRLPPPYGEPLCSCHPEKPFRMPLPVVSEPILTSVPIRRALPSG